MDPVELLQQINEIQRTRLAFVEKYAQGEQGAFAVADPGGRRFVLKWQPRQVRMSRLQYIRAVTDYLHMKGYPTPEYVWYGYALGGTYSIQTSLPGEPQHLPTEAQLSRLIALNELQVGQALPGKRDWPEEVVDTVLYGYQEYCVHASLQKHSPETAEMLVRLQELVLRHRGAITETNDIVHFDFNPANILIHGQEIGGVVDWDGVCAGDAAFDLATLLFYVYDDGVLRERLWRYALGRTSLAVMSVYLAHMILRQVDWSLRYHDALIADRYIARGQAILWGIEQRSHETR